MSVIVTPAITRRSFLIGVASTVAAPISDSAELPPAPLCGASAVMPASLPSDAPGLRPAGDLKLVAAIAQWPLVGERSRDTEVWCFDGRIPGPEIRLRRGEPVRITVENKLEQDTTVHWHGIRLPIAMDGVPGLTQPPIRPGESFVYEFTPPVPARSGTTPMPTACMAFVADNPGDWMLHCHVTDHQVSGLMTVLRVA